MFNITLLILSWENSLNKWSLAVVYFMISQSSSRSATTINLRMSDPCPSQPCWRLPYHNQWRDYSCLLKYLPPRPQPEGKDLQGHFQPEAHLSAAIRLALTREVPTETILASLFNLRIREENDIFLTEILKPLLCTPIQVETWGEQIVEFPLDSREREPPCDKRNLDFSKKLK